MKTPGVSQLDLVVEGFEPKFVGVSVAKPETVDVPAVETIRLRAENSRMRFQSAPRDGASPVPLGKMTAGVVVSFLIQTLSALCAPIDKIA
jgi:hypothetical protein